ncbi:MAG: hypothetical protein ABGZ17_09575, partial [Planctomycetaceae bacterium]
PPGARVLCVGEAEVFDAQFDIVYETVFDTSIFQTWFGRVGAASQQVDQSQLRSDAEIRRQLTSQRITHVYVNWADILRYRSTYGYTSFVTPRVFQVLVQRGLLTDFQTLAYLDYERLSDGERQQMDVWGQDLLQESSSERAVVGAQLFKVSAVRTDQENSPATDNRPE